MNEEIKQKFIIIQSNNLSDIENKVNEHIEEGYKLFSFFPYAKERATGSSPFFVCTMVLESTILTTVEETINNHYESH